MTTEPDRCPSSPDGESHRWALPPTGSELPATCKWCHATKLHRPFTAQADADASKRATGSARGVAARWGGHEKHVKRRSPDG